jgi:hypothetical protein
MSERMEAAIKADNVVPPFRMSELMNSENGAAAKVQAKNTIMTRKLRRMGSL